MRETPSEKYWKKTGQIKTLENTQPDSADPADLFRFLIEIVLSDSTI